MEQVTEVLKEEKQKFKSAPLQEFSCKWCGRRVLEDLGEVKGFAFLECRNCGFTFCPNISQELMERLYARGYHSNEEKMPEHGWFGIDFLNPVLKLFKPGESLKILNFGCGQSKVPQKLREIGHEVIGVDVAEPKIPHPDRITGNLLDLHLEPNQFNLVYSFQVFEHLREPRPVFRELIRLAKPNGCILIHTDMDTPEREEEFPMWWYVLPPDHCSFFSLKSFREILRKSPHLLVEENPKCVVIQKNGRK